ncbi:MAG: LLM class flavin-dependent oxidoreductase [Chloroflexi bacterium]|nr:LLM class flavin-dependent oxidoreductase [Chloroflexota bacterium]
MELIYFTEQPMATYPEEDAKLEVPIGPGKMQRVTSLMLSNKYFDPVSGSRLYNERLEEYVLVDEVGFDGIMLNEHHTAPFCMSPRINVFGSILAAITKRVKIVMHGNPLPVVDSPVHLSEELSMIDMISKGRLVSGFVRGGGVENIQANQNPVFNRERFDEAHDLVIKTWTTPGPFRWEGKHFQFRVVNPWTAPLQKPHPRIWIPGVASKETVVWAAEHRYPYVGLGTNFDLSQKIKDIYREAARRVGYEAGPEQFGQLLQCHVAETEEKAIKNAREFLWMQGEFLGLAHPVWANPSGYGSPATRRQRLEARKRVIPSFEQQLEMMQIIAGTPEQVVKKLRILLEGTRPSILALWGNDGMVNHEDSMTCIRLLGQEVMPALREIGKELELFSPIELNTPVSLAATPQHELTPSSA